VRESTVGLGLKLELLRKDLAAGPLLRSIRALVLAWSRLARLGLAGSAARLDRTLGTRLGLAVGSPVLHGALRVRTRRCLA